MEITNDDTKEIEIHSVVDNHCSSFHLRDCYSWGVVCQEWRAGKYDSNELELLKRVQLMFLGRGAFTIQNCLNAVQCTWRQFVSNCLEIPEQWRYEGAKNAGVERLPVWELGNDL
jgi:hypothetical protein